MAVHISGVIKNSTNIVELLDASEIGQLYYPNSILQFLPDDKGNFSVQFQLDKPGYFQIGRNNLFLAPGDNVQVDINMRNPNLSLFRGSHKNENDYLKSTPFPYGGSFLESGYCIKPSIEKNINTILKVAAARRLSLQSLIHLSSEFKAFENARIKADIINSLLSLPFYYSHENHIEKDSIQCYNERCEKASDSYLKKFRYNFINSCYLDLPVYRKIANYLLEHNPTPTKSSVKIKDYLKAEVLMKKINAADSKSRVLEVKPYIKEVIDPKYKSLLSLKVSRLLKYGAGDTARNFVAKDIFGKEVALKDYSGKVIFIEMWATWCVPCLEEMPYLEKLRSDYRTNPNIVFISISVDNDQSKWVRKVLSFDNKENQWIVDRSKLHEYEISSYPTSIIINKDFTVLSTHGPRPSSSQTKELLDELLSK